MKPLLLLALATAALTCCTSSLRAAPPTTGQFEVRVKRSDAGFDAYGVTLSNGLVIGKSGGVPAAVTVASDWADITSKPTTLAGYGITDPIVLTSSSYSNPAWITALAWSKISGTPTTLAGYGITDGITAAAAAAAYQPLDGNLTDLTTLALDAWGMGLLELADGDALRTYAGFGTLSTLNAVASAQITDGTIVNADISAGAAIAASKISGLGTLATLSAVASAQITDGTIVNADINASAAIDISKISGLQTALDGKWAKVSNIIGSTATLVAGTTTVVRGNATYTLTLPASPSDGDTVVLVQSGDTWSGTVTLGRNGSQINGASSDLSLGAPAGLYGGALLLTYHSASGGWITHRLADANGMSTIYATAGHTHTISGISSTTTNRLYGTGGTFATGQEIALSSALSLSAGTLTVASGGITNAMLAGSIDPAKTTGTAAVLGGNTFTAAQLINAGDGNPLKVQNGGSDRFKVTTTGSAGSFWVGHPSFHAYEADGNTWVYSYAGGERCRLIFGQNAYSILAKTTGGAGTGLLVADNAYQNSYIGGMLLDNTTVRTFLIEPTGRDAIGGYTGGGHTMKIKGGDGQTASTGAAGGEMQIVGGAAGGSGNNNGGNIILTGGAATGSGTKGRIIIDLNSLPTTDPGVAGELWRDGDAIKISHP